MKKYLITILVLSSSLIVFSQKKSAFYDTGKKQIWKVTIVWDTAGLPDETGYAEFKEQVFYAAPGSAFSKIPLPENQWVKTFRFWDASKHPVDGVSYIIWKNPKTGKTEQQ